MIWAWLSLEYDLKYNLSTQLCIYSYDIYS